MNSSGALGTFPHTQRRWGVRLAPLCSGERGSGVCTQVPRQRRFSAGPRRALRTQLVLGEEGSPRSFLSFSRVLRVGPAQGRALRSRAAAAGWDRRGPG